MFKPDPRILAQFHKKVATPELRNMQLELISNNFRSNEFSGMRPEKRNAIGNVLLGEMARKGALFESEHLMRRMKELAVQKGLEKLVAEKNFRRPFENPQLRKLPQETERKLAAFFKARTGKQLSAREILDLTMRRKMGPQ